MSVPIDTATPHIDIDSLDNNQLCGVDWRGEGYYTAEGITKLCEGLKDSVTSLKCAAALSDCVRFLSAPADTLHSYLHV